PGHYAIIPEAGPSTPLAAKQVDDREVGPNAVVQLTIPLERLLKITGRVVDAQTGQGIAGLGEQSTFIDEKNYLQFVLPAKTDADGRYTVGARPGKSVQIQLNSVPKA